MKQNSGKLWLIAAGTSKYDDKKSWSALNKVPYEIDLIAGFFGELGYQRVLQNVSLNPAHQDFGNALSDWCNHEDRKATDKLVLYYTGHGERLDRHYLVFKDSGKLKALSSTGLAVEELISTILYETRLQNFLLLLDTCYSGAGIEDAAALSGKVNECKDPHQPTHVYLMASATPIEKARQLRFAKVFVEAARNADGLTDGTLSDYLHPDKIIARVNASMKGQSSVGTSINVSGEPRFI